MLNSHSKHTPHTHSTCCTPMLCLLKHQHSSRRCSTLKPINHTTTWRLHPQSTIVARTSLQVCFYASCCGMHWHSALIQRQPTDVCVTACKFTTTLAQCTHAAYTSLLSPAAPSSHRAMEPEHLTSRIFFPIVDPLRIWLLALESAEVDCSLQYLSLHTALSLSLCVCVRVINSSVCLICCLISRSECASLKIAVSLTKHGLRLSCVILQVVAAVLQV